MSIFNMFTDRMTKVSVEGKRTESTVIMRRGKTISPQVIQNERMCVLQDDTVFESGDLMIAPDDKYYIVAKQFSQTGAIQAHLRKVNVFISVARLTPKYNDHMDKIGDQEEIVFGDIPSVQYTVSANMKHFDAGLLPNTVKKYVLPDMDVRLQDRIKINGNNYHIIGIDNDKYNNIIVVQCGFDTRKVINE